MVMNKYAALLILLLFSGCHKSNPHKLVQDANFKNCYQYAMAGNEVMLTINYNGDSIIGDLNYAFKEKDRNIGKIIGSMQGDTLFATYHYTSEGFLGKREVAFLKDGESFVEGSSILDPKTGEPDFSDHSKITFADGSRLQLTACQN